ncbi:MAG: chloride channel protein [Bacteroidetes bacterium HGW-Bacteroidetes-21]|nr:MAG: chloride channel protein [Bacteroidetes bacterium HGW-Bacteroidetes-21]
MGGLAAIVTKNIVFFISETVTGSFDKEYLNLLYLAFPFVGIMLTVLFTRNIIKENISHGISYVLRSISGKGGKIHNKHMYSSMVGSGMTVGLGGSVGLEAPIVFTGSAIGSWFAQLFRVNYKTTVLLIGCGAAAAIAGIFKAPITAVVFSLEVLMLDLTISSIVPLLISSVTGAVVANFLLGREVVFYFTLQDPVVMENLPFYIVLGLFTGLISVYFMRTTAFIELKFSKIKNPYQKIAIGGIILGVLIFLLPPLYGEGYIFLREILSGSPTELANNSLFYEFRDNYWIFILFLFFVIVFKVIAMAVTTGAGGVGGVFAPSLFIGGIAGYIGAKAINYMGVIRLSESNFSLVGMAGMIAGVMGAPLTAIFLIAELTGGYSLFIPLIITSAISFLTTRYFEHHSIYTKRLAESGELMTHDKDKNVLLLMRIKNVIENDFLTIQYHKSLRDLVNLISHSNRNIYPVVDEERKLVGVIYLDHIRHLIFKNELYDTMSVSDLMVVPAEIISLNDRMEAIMEKFEKSEAWNLPVIENEVYIGFISKSKLLNEYREIMQELSSE